MSVVRRPMAHFVAWRLNGTTAEARAEQARSIVREYEASREEFQGLLRMEIGSNEADADDAWDVALYMVFASREDLDAYRIHQEHIRLKALIGPMRAARAQVDFESEGWGELWRRFQDA